MAQPNVPTTPAAAPAPAPKDDASRPATPAELSVKAGQRAKLPFGPTADDNETQGFSPARLARIPAALQAQVDAGVIPGAVSLVARNGHTVQLEAVGFLDAARSKPMPRDAIFRLASMTKPIVTTAAMMLVEQGRMKLSDPIAEWLPELKDLKVETAAGDKPLARPIWVQDLMRHTAGFVYAGSTRSARIKKMYEDSNIESREFDITSEEMLQRLGRIPLAHQPGTFWEYSVATDVLGLLLERASGKRLDVLFDELLLRPLGMTDTAFWVPPEKRGRLAEALDADPQKAAMLKSYRDSEPPSGRNYLKGGAGLVGTAADYLKFAQMLANGGTYDGKRYLSRKTVDFMLSDHILDMGGTTVGTTGPGYGFGLGFGVRRHPGMNWVAGSVGEATWSGAWGTTFWIDREQRLVGMLMTQAPTPRISTRMLYRTLVYGAVGG